MLSPVAERSGYLSIDATRKHVEEKFAKFDRETLPGLGGEIWNIPDGMAKTIWQDKYSRIKPDGSYQTWEERIREVVAGTFMLERPSVHKTNKNFLKSETVEYVDVVKTHYTDEDFNDTLALSLRGAMAYSGRHLQHGDWDQPYKKLEKLANCSTGIFSFMTFKLGLDGSGVGSDYSCATRLCNWDKMPYIRCVLDVKHKDYGKAYNEFQGAFDNLAEAENKYPNQSDSVRWFKVKDTCEGWVEAIAAIETAAFHGNSADKQFIFDFSDVREEGAPIKGQQNRPASGPIPLMRAFMKIMSIRGAGMPPWKQALYIDHYLAASTIIGGIRRMARMATKWWKDKDIIDFIRIKRNSKDTGVLWTANHSILVDAEFWEQVKDPRTDAAMIFQAATAAAYFDRSGEPGFINVDKLNQQRESLDEIDADNLLHDGYFGLKFHPKTKEMCGKVINAVKKLKYFMIVNPCSEISLSTLGGYCLVGDVNGARCDTKKDFFRACELMAMALIRTNTMTAIYRAETDRTNRIGVSIIGIHEMAWNLFNLTFYDMIAVYDMIKDKTDWDVACMMQRYHKKENDELTFKQYSALNFWLTLAGGRDATEAKAAEYSKKLGMAVPHTATCLKPGGTVSKVMTTTESANLPAYATYLRWVQMEKIYGGVPNEKLADHEARGYPIIDISQSAQYPGKCIIGFPTKQPIVDIMGGENVVTAADVSPEDHYKWLSLLERFWLGGKNEDGSMRNNMISYTLKFKTQSEDQPDGVTYEQFKNTILEWQPKIRCCAFDASQSIGELKSAHVYVPEEPISYETYKELTSKINKLENEEYDEENLQCASGICPIEPSINRRETAKTA